MAVTFSRSLRALATRGPRDGIVALGLAVVLLASWTAWLCLSRVALYEVSDSARLELSEGACAIEARLDGTVVAARLALGRSVKRGEVLVELDSSNEKLKLAEEQAKLASMNIEVASIRSEVAAQTRAERSDLEASEAAIGGARARHDEARHALAIKEEEHRRNKKMFESEQMSELDFRKVTTEVEKLKAEATSAEFEVKRLELARLTQQSAAEARLEQLRRAVLTTEGQIVAQEATVRRLSHDVELMLIRAPADGVLAEAAILRPGAFVKNGDRLGEILAPGGLKGVAKFRPAALGRVRVGQPGRMKLHGFPWTEYGTLPATVATVASEVRDNEVTVELSVRPDPSSRITFQHGLPGDVEVEVERVSPMSLVLRSLVPDRSAAAPFVPSTPAPGQDDRR